MASINNINYHGEDIPLKTLVKELIGELISEGAFVFSTTANSEDLKLTVDGKSTSVSLQNPIRNAVKNMITNTKLYLSVNSNVGEISLIAKDNTTSDGNESKIGIQDSVQNKVANMVENNELYTGKINTDPSKVYTFAETFNGNILHSTIGYNIADVKGNYVKYATALVPYSVSDSDKNGNLQTISEQGDVTSKSNAYPVRAVGTDGDLYGHTLTLN